MGTTVSQTSRHVWWKRRLKRPDVKKLLKRKKWHFFLNTGHRTVCKISKKNISPMRELDGGKGGSPWQHYWLLPGFCAEAKERKVMECGLYVWIRPVCCPCLQDHWCKKKKKNKTEGMLKEHWNERSVTLESHSTEALGYYVPFCTFFDWLVFIHWPYWLWVLE